MFDRHLDAERAFIQNFGEKAATYIETFHEVEAVQAQDEDRYVARRISEHERNERLSRWNSQREELTRLHDKASTISEKYNIHNEYWKLIHIKPGDSAGDWGGKATL